MNIQSQDIIKVGLSCAIHKKRNDNILIYTILDVR